MVTAAIIQARTGSTRLPGKVMADICGEPMLAHVVRRAQQARKVDVVTVATSKHSDDDPIAAFCRGRGVGVFRGSLDDVLDRYYHAAGSVNATCIVRLTADCPMLDPQVIDQVIDTWEIGSYDYVSNAIDCTFPDGLDTEAFSRVALDAAWRNARLPSEREHVTPYIRNHPEKFRIGKVTCSEDLSALRWTVDEPADLDFVRAIYAAIGSASFGMAEVLAVLDAHPEMGRINQGISRNEGYARSLVHDRCLEKREGR